MATTMTRIPRLLSSRARYLLQQQRSYFVQSSRLLDGQFPKYEAPRQIPESDEQQPPAPKASIRSKVIAVGVGMSVALLYAAYKRRNVPEEKKSDGFAIFTLVDKEPVSSTTAIFTLKPLGSKLRASTKIDSDGGIYSVQLKQPQLQIARNYTLLPAIPGEPLALRLLIKREEKGEVSGYLHTLKLGDDVEVRGPYKDFAFPETLDKVVFIAGGTGIAPALKVADALKEKDVHILWANRRREDCLGGESDNSEPRWWWSSPPAKRAAGERNTTVLLLELLKQSSKLSVDYFVDEESTHIRPTKVSKLLKDGTGVIFVSGPDGFINHWAGPKTIDGQGEVGGILRKMDLRGWQVVKL